MQQRQGFTLSKSRFVAGLQCHKRLWIEVRARQLIPAVEEATQARFDQGHRVGELATRLFPEGIEIDRSTRDWGRLEAATRSALEQGRPLFEAAFRWQGAACRVDILAPVANGGWEVLEVKSSTGVKDVYLEDLALQAFVIEGAGLSVEDYYLVHLDGTYSRQGELDLESLFVRECVTDQVRRRQQAVGPHLLAMHRVVAAEHPPDIAIGPHCDSPYACPVKDHCWSILPQGSVLELARDRRKGFDLLAEGIVEMADIPTSVVLDSRQRLQVEALRSGQPHVDRAALEAFLDQLAYPVYFFDIESFSSPVPLYDNSRPYQQIPFLFSIHRIERPGGDARHFSHLAAGPGDPRPEFLRAARSALGQRGSIVAYNASFEKRILRQASVDALPELEDWVCGLEGRFVDLLQPFRDFYYYHPAQAGRASLKLVLEPLTGLSYSDLEIADGETAGREFLRVQAADIDIHDRSRTLRQLVDYCSLDTYGMVSIVDRLHGLVAAGDATASQPAEGAVEREEPRGAPAQEGDS